jgi:hypothetical protein
MFVGEWVQTWPIPSPEKNLAAQHRYWEIHEKRFTQQLPNTGDLARLAVLATVRLVLAPPGVLFRALKVAHLGTDNKSEVDRIEMVSRYFKRVGRDLMAQDGNALVIYIQTTSP